MDNWKSIKNQAESDPTALIQKIEDGSLGNYQVPILYSNVHANEVSSTDGILKFARMLLEAEYLYCMTLVSVTNERTEEVSGYLEQRILKRLPELFTGKVLSETELSLLRDYVRKADVDGAFPAVSQITDLLERGSDAGAQVGECGSFRQFLRQFAVPIDGFAQQHHDGIHQAVQHPADHTAQEGQYL